MFCREEGGLILCSALAAPLVVAMQLMDLVFCTTIDSMQTRPLTMEERALIVDMRQSGIKSSDIAKNLDMSQSTISIVLTKWKVSDCTTTQKSRHQPRNYLIVHCQSLAQCDINQDRRQTLATLVANYQAHRNTIQTCIRRLGFGITLLSRKLYPNSIH